MTTTVGARGWESSSWQQHPATEGRRGGAPSRIRSASVTAIGAPRADPTLAVPHSRPPKEGTKRPRVHVSQPWNGGQKAEVGPEPASLWGGGVKEQPPRIRRTVTSAEGSPACTHCTHAPGSLPQHSPNLPWRPSDQMLTGISQPPASGAALA